VRASPEAAAPWAPPLDAAGLGLRGVLAREDWDARVPPAFRAERLLPAARAVLVVGSAGRALFETFAHSPEAADGRAHPIDRYTERVLDETARRVAEAGVAARPVLAHEEREGSYADFVALGRACGLGHPSRLGLLLHPVYGPWTSLRGALLLDAALAATPALAGRAPCEGCPAPCEEACPTDAPRPEGFDVERCRAGRRAEPGCRWRCAARRACVVGPQHAYTERAEAHHMEAAWTWVCAPR